MKANLKTMAALFGSFFKIGAFTFGGGYAMIPLIQAEAAQKRHWVTDEDILEIVAIAESAPGPIAINAATFVGYRVGGFFGAMSATLGVVLPSFLIILAVSYVLRQFRENRYVAFAFQGIRAGVLALIVKALWQMYRKCKKNAVSYLIMAAVFVLVAFVKVSVLPVLAGCALVGLLSAVIMDRRAKA